MQTISIMGPVSGLIFNPSFTSRAASRYEASQPVHRKKRPISASTVRVLNDFFTSSSQDAIPVSTGSSIPTMRKSSQDTAIPRLLKELKYAYDKLTYYKSYEDGWQGPDSRVPSRKAFSDAELFIEQASSLIPKFVFPMIGIDGEGEIVLTWNDEGIIGSASIAGDGIYHFYCENEKLESFANGSSKFNEKFPLDLINVFCMR